VLEHVGGDHAVERSQRGQALAGEQLLDIFGDHTIETGRRVRGVVNVHFDPDHLCSLTALECQPEDAG
jgi:hypothetical protein